MENYISNVLSMGYLKSIDCLGKMKLQRNILFIQIESKEPPHFSQTNQPLQNHISIFRQLVYKRSARMGDPFQFLIFLLQTPFSLVKPQK